MFYLSFLEMHSDISIIFDFLHYFLGSPNKFSVHNTNYSLLGGSFKKKAFVTVVLGDLQTSNLFLDYHMEDKVEV